MSKRPNGVQMSFQKYFFNLFIFQIHLQINEISYSHKIKLE